MKIKISKENKEKIEKVLSETCGEGRYVYSKYEDVADVCADFEKQLDKLGLAKSLRGGAVAEDVSGCAVGNSYRHSRKGTKLELVRGDKDWFLSGIAIQMIGQSGGWSYLRLTKNQDERIIDRIRSQYTVAS